MKEHRYAIVADGETRMITNCSCNEKYEHTVST